MARARRVQTQAPLRRDAGAQRRRSTSRTIRSITSTSRARSRRAATAPAPVVVVFEGRGLPVATRTVSVYSLRAKERLTVSTPVTWEEVAACRDAGDPGLLRFEHDQVLARVAEHGDLFGEVLSLVQSLPALRGLRG
jgi:hypothetical protein